MCSEIIEKHLGKDLANMVNTYGKIQPLDKDWLDDGKYIMYFECMGDIKMFEDYERLTKDSNMLNISKFLQKYIHKNPKLFRTFMNHYFGLYPSEIEKVGNHYEEKGRNLKQFRFKLLYKNGMDDYFADESFVDLT